MGSQETHIPRADKQIAAIAKGLKESYPDITKYLGEQLIPEAQYNLGAQEAIAPREEALNATYSQGGSNRDLAAIQGAGGRGVMAAEGINRQIDPEYYATREASSNKLGQLLSGIDPNRLTGAERENVARGLARSNPSEVGAPSNQGAINAALTYGGALDTKRNTVANAINSATQALPGFNQGKDVFGQATSGARFGVNPSAGQAFTNAQAGNQSALDVTGQAGRLRAQLQAATDKTVHDKVTEGVGSVNCCFIFLECYNGKLPEHVRVCRDYWYSIYPDLGRGYKRMAKWLVPMMQKSKIVRHTVNILMVKPISRIGEWLTGGDSYNSIDMFIHNTWFSFWKWYGSKV